MQKTHQKKDPIKKLYLGVALACVVILFLGSISLSQHAKFDRVSLTVLPSVQREGMPLLIRFDLNNPTQKEDLMIYELYANGQLLMQGKELLPPASTEHLTYVYPDSPKLGERITFLARAESDWGSYEKTLSTPAYPPQIWSSFVSFASFSTSMMGSTMSIASVQYYDTSFLDNNKLNVGLMFSMVLIFLLVFLELTEPVVDKGFRIMGLRIRFSRLSAILFIVFVGMVFTKVTMAVG